MASQIIFLFILAVTVHGTPVKILKPLASEVQLQKTDEKQDLKTASSSYSHQYSDWRGRNPGGYEFSVTGYGTVDDQARANIGDVGGYNNVGYVSPGFGARPGYSGGYGGYKGYDGLSPSGYEGGIGGYGLDSYGRNDGYSGNNGYAGSAGYSVNGINSGNGGYGGYGGNGGLSSYYGYNNPYYQGNNHLGYGYYNKRPGYGNIYRSGITPSLVTGYRGYSR